MTPIIPTTQPEQVLENELVGQLIGQGYIQVAVTDEATMLANLKAQLEALFVISNGVNTKYYANARRQSFKQTFYWAAEDNKTIRELPAFTTAFLNRQHLGTMIGKTLTSFKAAQIITGLPGVTKVVFCVDRKDLDYQTIKEFNGFKPVLTSG